MRTKTPDVEQQAAEAPAKLSKQERREATLNQILSTPDHRGVKKLGDVGFVTGKRMVLAAVGVQIFYVAYDLLTQITPVQKNFWDNTIWRGRNGPLKNVRHAFRDVGEGWLAETLARSRAWKGYKKARKATNGLMWKLGGRYMLAFEATVLRAPTRATFEDQGNSLSRWQTTKLGVVCATRGVAAGALAYVLVHRAGTPLMHVAGAHVSTAVTNHQGSLTDALNSHLRTVGSVNPTLVGRAEHLAAGVGHTMLNNLTGGLPNKIIGVVAGLAAKGPNSLRAEARRMRIAGKIVSMERSYHPWYGEPMRQAVREVAAKRGVGALTA